VNDGRLISTAVGACKLACRHHHLIQMAGQRVVVPCALISPRAEMCEQSELSELSLLLFPGRAPGGKW
jgi:hypothetical protein